MNTNAVSVPRCSVLIPAYNAAHTVRRAVMSALAQTEHRCEVVVVDDGSTDGTAEVLRDILDERLTVLRHRENAGVGAARNAALARSTGEWIGVLDADDEWHPTRVETLLRAAEADGADMVADDLTLSRNGRPIGTALNRRGFRRGATRVDLVDFVRFDLAILKPIVRRTCIGSLNWRTDLAITEDFHFCFELLDRGCTYLLIDTSLYTYNVASGATSRQSPAVVQAAADAVEVLLRARDDTDMVSAALRIRRHQLRASLRDAEWRAALRQRAWGGLLAYGLNPEHRVVAMRRLRGKLLLAWRGHV